MKIINHQQQNLREIKAIKIFLFLRKYKVMREKSNNKWKTFSFNFKKGNHHRIYKKE